MFIGVLLFIFFVCCDSQTGIFHTPEEIEVWKERSLKGPYKTENDDFVKSPGDFERIKQNAMEFLENSKKESGSDIWNGDWNVWESDTGRRTRDAGFMYLLTGNRSYAEAVKKELYAQYQIPNANFSKREILAGQADSLYSEFQTCGAWARFLFAYDYTKEIFSEEEREEMDEWFRGIGTWYVNNDHLSLEKYLWPDRLNRNYSTWGSIAIKAEHPDDSYFTHLNEDGSIGNKILHLPMFYNNRVGAHYIVASLIGVFLKDEYIINHCKLFAEEFIMFAVYPDGSHSEYERNGDYGFPHSGIFYGSYLISFVSILSEALARIGDFSMYEFCSSQGYYESTGGNKSLELLINTHLSLYDESLKRYYFNVSDQTPKDEYQLKSYYESETGPVFRYVYDIWFSMANHYYKSDYFLNIYSRDESSTIPKIQESDFIQGEGYYSSPFEGPHHIFPGVLFMFGKMEEYQYSYTKIDEQDGNYLQYAFWVVIASISIGLFFFFNSYCSCYFNYNH